MITRWILFLAALVLVAATPEKLHEIPVKFISAKKVKTGIYDITVAFLDRNNEVLKGVNSNCDSIVTIFGYDTYIMREPKWTSYYVFIPNPDNPEEEGALYPMNELKWYRKFGLPFNKILYYEKGD